MPDDTYTVHLRVVAQGPEKPWDDVAHAIKGELERCWPTVGRDTAFEIVAVEIDTAEAID